MDQLSKYRNFSSNYFQALARSAVSARILNETFKDYPKNIPKELHEKLLADTRYQKEKRKARRERRLESFLEENPPPKFDALTKFTMLLFYSNAVKFDVIMKSMNEEDFQEVYMKMKVKDFYHTNYLKRCNITDYNQTVEECMKKHNTKNPVGLTEFSDDEYEDYLQSSFDCRNQLHHQTLSMLFAYFESFLKNSIEVLRKKKSLQARISGVPIPQLYPTCFSKLFEFITKTNLSSNLKKETKVDLWQAWKLRNLIVHNGGFLNKEFISKNKDWKQSPGEYIKLRSEYLAEIFAIIWRYSLRLFHELTN